jgi:protein-tyrosine phosphatase
VIDIHLHPLPFVDDGAADWDVSLDMARMASQDGVKQWIATSHWTGVAGEAERIAEQMEGLRSRLADARISIRLHRGNEVILVPNLVEALRSGSAATLAGSNYILLETAQLEHGAYVQQALFQLQSSGYRVILAHPERVKSWQDGNLGELRDLIQRGCRLQINAGSLAGSFGPGAKKTALELLRNRWVSLLASDSHSNTKRPPILSRAREECARILGDEGARVLVEDNPARILCNEELPWIDVDETPRRRFSFPWPWRR